MQELSGGFPAQALTPDARWLVERLQAVDRRLTHPVCLRVYGSVAVSLYLADDLAQPYSGYTDDVDYCPASTERGLSDVLRAATPPLTPSLEFRPSQIELWLIHPDWKDALCDVSGFVGLKKLQLLLVSPRDLVLTKLERYSERDASDCYRIAQRYLAPSSFLDDLDEALAYAVIAPRKVKRILEAARYDLFPDAFPWPDALS